ncbi:polysaccharide deacetylase family protein [Pollutibacter soli]|uniref:polysaccharide deacetylase family protein n=1 Tax=Pollutibacter soli TaxID=3034157 RepID=UPI0030138919
MNQSKALRALVCSVLLVSATSMIISGCTRTRAGINTENAESAVDKDSIATNPAKELPAAPAPESLKIANAKAILERRQIPILCYHQIRDWKATDSKTAKPYIVPVDAFKAQMKALADSGYTTILPDQLFSYLATGTEIPEKSVMLTFDDGDADQVTTGLPELNKYGFKAVYFIMTVSMGRSIYMTKEQIRALSDAGHVIGSHTWDHKNVKKFEDADWATQIEKPSKQLEEITGKPVKYFAYPFGLWKPEVIAPLKERGMVAAFQLSTARDENDPLHTIRRIIVPGTWSGEALIKNMKSSFK